jgi:hypothetical protein
MGSCTRAVAETQNFLLQPSFLPPLIFFGQDEARLLSCVEHILSDTALEVTRWPQHESQDGLLYNSITGETPSKQSEVKFAPPYQSPRACSVCTPSLHCIECCAFVLSRTPSPSPAEILHRIATRLPSEQVTSRTPMHHDLQVGGLPLSLTPFLGCHLGIMLSPLTHARYPGNN